MVIEKILIVDDEKLVRDFLFETLKRKKYEVEVVDCGQKALSLLKERPFDLMIADMKMPTLTGVDLLKKTKELYPSLIVIIITAYGSIENAVEAMKHGAYNYILKPFSPDSIEVLIEKAKAEQSSINETTYLTNHVISNPTSPLPIGESPAMKQIFSDVARIAKSNANVLITGESGTGKEVIAQLIHMYSLRKDKPFIKVNCAAVPETLIESEFFGHEKGAFTGAQNMHRGRFELAHGGSLLLDEITEVPLGMQAKLLRAIQEHEFERVGGIRLIKVDVRIISTSNRNMIDALQSKKIREDLYYRLNVMPIHLPPLRERIEDILPLAEFFLSKFKKESIKLTREAKNKLLSYSWPGNVRELANLIERAVVLNTSGSISPEEIYISPHSHAILSERELTLQELEKQLIIETLQKMDNNRRKTAEKLGISVRTLHNKLQIYKINSSK